MNNILLDYIRMVSYSIVILSSLRDIANRKFTNILFIGDIIVALFLLVGNVLSVWFNLDRAYIGGMMTCPVVIWALIHFSAMIKSNNFKKVKK